ncbi:ATP-dependent helicase [Heyndrickxia sporothermodurans]|uniref:ATP-dependent DNA helicase n=1 Tax=Heyndrickxia TaxID=2837504 RepID=UPI000D369764|nr:ATP-dependent DNA helicase [Heyndrickxia sporothermodurans]PTY78726.1 ATP-dependent helicase [Heyndrickxia sporothermodurans]
MRTGLPFTIAKEESFYEKLGDWIGDVFYEILPEKGFELRDEQIYMAFQMEKAFKDKKVVFAEAGVGTGKTIVYLLYALCYARYTGKPAIIACADETLIEQLMKKEGDIKKLEVALGLQADVRLAKSRDQYLCLKKLDTQMQKNDTDDINSIYDNLPEFVHAQGSMLKYEKYGDRKEYSNLSEKTWKTVAWDSLQDCFSCDVRHRCGQTLHRDYYRKAADIIVCSHDYYMEHVWTKESRIREGQLPLLPEASCVIFDEGHLLEFACQKALTYRIQTETLETLLTRLMENDVRDETLYTIENVLFLNDKLFENMIKEATPVVGSERFEIKKSAQILKFAQSLRLQIDKLSEQLVYEGEMFVLNEYDLRIVEEYLEQILYSLKLFIEDTEGIVWFEMTESDHTLVIMPRLVEEVLRKEVFSKNIPYIFSSATLSNNGDYSYIANSLGIDSYLSFKVDSPFDYESNMEVFIHRNNGTQYDEFLSLLKEAGGRSLLLFSSKDSISEFKRYVLQQKDIGLNMLFEGDKEISHLVSQFQENEETVLCAYHLWEGLDIPGPSLSNVMIAELPFPPKDPVFDAKRKVSVNPFNEVDVPYMLLRLKQGIGRLIRTSTDKGTIHIWMSPSENDEILDSILPLLPVKPAFYK